MRLTGIAAAFTSRVMAESVVVFPLEIRVSLNSQQYSRQVVKRPHRLWTLASLRVEAVIQRI